jgi:hypothetical protein
MHFPHEGGYMDYRRGAEWYLRKLRGVVRFELSHAKRELLMPFSKHAVKRHIETIHKHSPANLSVEDLIVVGPVYNGAAHVETFVQHYLALGASEIVLLDNGSRDETIELARRFEKVTVLRCPLPFSRYSLAMRRYLVENFSDGCWCLLSDIDERFDYPFSEVLPLPAFLRYLRNRGFDSVAAPMLDLFPAGGLMSWPKGGRDLINAAVWYDLQDISINRLPRIGRRNQFPVAETPYFKGGIRQKEFGISLPLTKFPLMFRKHGQGPTLRNAHLVAGARVADVSGVLLHYKFDGAFRERSTEAVREGNYFAKSFAYRAHLRRLSEEPQLMLRSPGARRFKNTTELIDSGFVQVSDAYRRYVEEWIDGSAKQALR